MGWGGAAPEDFADGEGDVEEAGDSFADGEGDVEEAGDRFADDEEAGEIFADGDEADFIFLYLLRASTTRFSTRVSRASTAVASSTRPKWWSEGSGRAPGGAGCRAAHSAEQLLSLVLMVFCPGKQINTSTIR